MTKIILKSRNDYDEVTGTFAFNPDTWEVIGSEGTGGLGHYSQQGERDLHVSPKPSPKLGRHRFVLYGTGYYAVESGGSSWGTDAREVDLETALQIMDPKQVARFGGAIENLEAVES